MVSNGKRNRAATSSRPETRRAARRAAAARPRAVVAAESLEHRTMLADAVGAVFVATNHNNSQDAGEPGNEVVMYNQAADGSLSVLGRFDTGGQGAGPSIRFAGDGLGSSHSVQLSQSGRFLFVANAGSDSVSVFRVHRDGLTLTDVEPTQDFPNSVTQFGQRVYVLGGSGEGSIKGYHLSPSGNLSPLSNSTRSLNANQDPNRPDVLTNQTQVSFTPSGKQLVVTIKDGPAAGAPIPNFDEPTGPGRVLVWNVDATGRPSQNFRQTNFSNRGPFGFSFDRQGRLLTTFFVGGPNLSSSVGAFRINPSGSLAPITRNVPNTQLDSCWIENNGTYAYSANYGSGTISSYRIAGNGGLTLLEAVAGQADDLPGGDGKSQGATPLDIRVSPDGKFLYNVLPGSGAVGGWRINADGSLDKLGEFRGLPETVNGDSAPVEFGPGGSPAGIDVVRYGSVHQFTKPRNFVYVMTNDPRTNRNSILAYRRNPNTGALTELSSSPFDTGGTGFLNVDDRIGPDDSDQEVIVTRDRKFLLAVNQGSDTISVFRIADNGTLDLVGTPTPSGGKQPVSLGLARNNTLVVVNRGDQDPGQDTGGSKPNYTTFEFDPDTGDLDPIPGSTIETGNGDSPTQALISRNGRFVFGDNFLADEFTPPPGFPAAVPPFGSELVSFEVEAEGDLRLTGGPSPSPLPLPDNYLLNLQIHPTTNVVYAGGVVGNKIHVYTHDDEGKLTFVRAVPTSGAGICWIVTNQEGTRAYGTNFATNSVVVFDITDPLNPVELQDLPLNGPKGPHPDGPASPALFNTVAFQEALSPDGKTLYVLNHEQTPANNFPQGNQLHILRVQPDGTLTERVTSPLVFDTADVPANAHPMGVVAI